MKKVNLFLTFILFLINRIIFSPNIVERALSVEKVLQEKLGNNKSRKQSKKSKRKNINFSFKDVELFDVIYEIAKQKNVNIIFPPGEEQKKELRAKLTINIPDKLSIGEAWDNLYTILDVAGYTMIPNSDGFSVVKVSKDISRESLRIFIGVPYKTLPDTDERIIYLAYFSNIQVPSGQGEGENLFQKLFSLYLSKDVQGSIRFAPSSNGVMIVDRGNNIRAVMKILTELDKIGVKEHIEIMPLQYTSAGVIAKLFNDPQGILGKAPARRYRLGARRKSELSYFEKGTKVIAEPRTNSLILVGNTEAVQKIKGFLYKYIDIDIESGRSILHTYKLDYMDANKLKAVLSSVVEGGGGNEEQARAGSGAYGPERFFSGVKIETDSPREAEGETELGKYKYYGTNSLVVAAKSDDWKKIKGLIETLDKAQPQVIIEVLIVDLRLEDTKALGGHTRNPALAPLMRLSREGQRVNAQAAHLTPVVGCPEGDVTRKSINADLDVDVTSGSYPPVSSLSNNALASASAGSTMFTLSDECGRTWSVLKVLSVYNNAKVLSHPYIVARHNKEALVKVGEERVLQGNAETSAGGGVRVKKDPIPANLTVKIKPRIVGDDIVNTEISIEIDQWRDPFIQTEAGQEETNPRIVRSLLTNANIKSGEILTIGGLIRTQDTTGEKKTPILGRIPILGWFFKSKSDQKQKANLTVFIRPTIVFPVDREDIEAYTNDYINFAKGHSREAGLFEGLRDPVTRWFFRDSEPFDEEIDDFVDQHQKKYELDQILVKGEDKADKDILLAQNKAQEQVKKDLNYDSKKATSENQQEENIVVVDNSVLGGHDQINDQKSEVLVTDVEIEQVMNNIEIADLEIDINQVKPEAKQEDIFIDDKLKALLQNIGNPFVS